MPLKQLILLFLWMVVASISISHGSVAPAQKPAYIYLHLDQEDGLASNDVLAILQDRKGFLWIGTNNGLQRYDGRLFMHFRYNPYTTNSLASDIVESLFEDTNGELWIASANTVTRFNPQTNQFIRIQIPAHKEGGTSSRSYFLEDEKHQIWLFSCTGQRAFLYKEAQNTFVQVQALPSFSNPYSTYAPLLDPWKSNEAYVYLLDSRGIVWAGSEKLLALYPGASGFEMIPTQINSRYGLDYNRIFALAEDRDGTLWIGTDKGIYYFNPDKQHFFSVPVPVRTYTDADGPIPTDFIQTQTGEIWVSTLNSGVLIYDNELNLINNHLLSNTAKLPLWCLVQDSRGTVWGGSQDGTLLKMKPDGSVTSIRSSVLAGQNITEGVLDANGTIWLGSDQGRVFNLNPLTQNVTILPLKTGKDRPGRVLRILPQQTSYVWVATTEGGIFKFHKGTATVTEQYNTSAKPYPLLSNQVGDMQWVDSTTLAISTIAGLHLLDISQKSIKTFTTSEGLPANALINVLPVRNGDFYVTPQNGLSRWNLKTGQLTTFGIREGLPDIPFIFNVSARLQDGRILLATMNSFFYFHPDSLTAHRAPADVLITGVKVMDRYISLDSATARDGSLRLTYHQNFFTIEYASLNYYDDKRISYYYQLEGIDQDWVKAGTNRFANYTHIEGGNYRFKVKALRDDGIPTLHETAFAIHIDQPFWKTWWFGGLLVLALAAIGAGIYRLRVERILALQHMRVQISRDLHDDMGSTLSTINILSAMARQQIEKKTGHTAGYLEKISDYSQRMMETMDDIVWSVNPLNDAAQNLVARMRNFCGEVLEPKGIAFIFEEEIPASLRLPLPMKHNCFMIFKEAINNAAKYAQCQCVRISIKIHKKQLSLSIQDDGIGFDTSQMSEGNGLLNMQARATAMKGKLKIVSAESTGTRITLLAPIG